VKNQNFNSKEIEIVISDNASTDNTREVGSEYAGKYKFIKYYRNEANIEDRNFPTVISKASGIYRKLINDTSLLNAESLDYILDAVKINVDKKPVLFFSNKINLVDAHHNSKYCTLREFVEKSSYFMTWIGSFGIWESDFIEIKDKFAGCEGRFWHVEKLLECGLKNKLFIIYPGMIINIQNIAKKNLGYGVFNVYIKNYLGVLSNYHKLGLLTKEDILREDRRLLFGYFSDHFINMALTSSRYHKNGWNGVNIFFLHYIKKWYFSLFFIAILINIISRVKNKMINIFRKITA
jgi:glycosyltransferase involved in cell wall biosynthesis